MSKDNLKIKPIFFIWSLVFLLFSINTLANECDDLVSRATDPDRISEPVDLKSKSNKYCQTASNSFH